MRYLWKLYVESRFSNVRDWSLITGRGGGLQDGGGACEVLPLRKAEAEKVLAMLKGGTVPHKKFLR